MATYGTISAQYWKESNILLYWERESVSIPDNTSTIKWELRLSTYNALTNLEESYTVTIDGKQYSGKSTIKNLILASGKTTIQHNPNGSKEFAYSFTCSKINIDFGTVAASGTAILDILPRQAHILSATSFLDTQNPYITYSNVAGEGAESLQACISLTGEWDDVPYRDIPKTGDTYTFELTEEERVTLRQAVTSGRSISVQFFLRSVVNGITYHSALTRQFTLVDYTPQLNPVAYDTNARTIELTGDRNTFIKYFSNVYYDSGAVARKEALIDTQYVTCGGTTITTGESFLNGTIEGIESNTFYFGATDTRGNSIKKALVRTLIPYVKLTSYLSTDLMNANGELTFTVKGKYYNGSFGAKNNSMEVEFALVDYNGAYAFNADGSGWVKLGIVNPTVDSEGNYEYSYKITGLDYESQYELTVNVIDELSPLQTSATIIQAASVFDWGKSDFRHNTQVTFSNNCPIQGIKPDGAARVVFEPCNSQNNTVLNYGGYWQGDGNTNIYGNNINLTSREKVLINGFSYGENKILYSGASHMNASQTITLSEAVSKQANGIILVFSLYRNGAAEDVSIQSFFVSKQEVALLPNAPHSFFLVVNAGFSIIGAKYLYIDDKTITGHSGNTSTGANNGINFNNSNYVLRYVIGV